MQQVGRDSEVVSVPVSGGGETSGDPASRASVDAALEAFIRAAQGAPPETGEGFSLLVDEVLEQPVDADLPGSAPIDFAGLAGLEGLERLGGLGGAALSPGAHAEVIAAPAAALSAEAEVEEPGGDPADLRELAELAAVDEPEFAFSEPPPMAGEALAAVPRLATRPAVAPAPGPASPRSLPRAAGGGAALRGAALVLCTLLVAAAVGFVVFAPPRTDPSAPPPAPAAAAPSLRPTPAAAARPTAAISVGPLLTPLAGAAPAPADPAVAPPVDSTDDRKRGKADPLAR